MNGLNNGVENPEAPLNSPGIPEAGNFSLSSEMSPTGVEKKPDIKQSGQEIGLTVEASKSPGEKSTSEVVNIGNVPEDLTQVKTEELSTEQSIPLTPEQLHEGLHTEAHLIKNSTVTSNEHANSVFIGLERLKKSHQQ